MRFVLRIALWIAIVLTLTDTGWALLIFARRFETSCMTCHVVIPKLNAFGIAFRNNGYKIPLNDEKLIKVPDVALGAPAWKQLWPRAVWPVSSVVSRRTIGWPTATSWPISTRTSMTFPATSVLTRAWSGETRVPDKSTDRSIEMR